MTRPKLIPLIAGACGAGLLALELAGGEPNWFWVVVAGLAVMLGLAGLVSGGGDGPAAGG